jgi:hypothetical protein
MSPTRLLSAAATAALPLAAAACVFSASVLKPDPMDGQGGASGAGGAASSSSGGGPRCDAFDACDDSNPCTTDGCDIFTRACYHNKRNGPTPEVNDNNPCTEDVCSDGAARHTKRPAGESCGISLMCSTDGRCVGCTSEMQCLPPSECKVATCVNSECGVENGGLGTPCSFGKCDGNGACVECLGEADCQGNAYCMNGSCVPDTCINNQKDSLETDVDCGGPLCPKCVNGKACITAFDCVSDKCTSYICG